MSVISKIRTFVFKNIVTRYTRFYYVTLFGMDIGKGVRISRRARLDKTNARGLHIGDHTMITGGVSILTHDFVNRTWKEVHVGKHCFIGYNAVVMPGVRIGDGCIIGANSVVTRDIPAYSVAVGVPAKVLQSDIVTGPYGIRLDRGDERPVAI